MLCVLPLGCLLALNHLQEVQVLLLKFLHLEVQLVEAARKEAEGFPNGLTQLVSLVCSLEIYSYSYCVEDL